jgi:hypothetical protein
MSSYDWIIELRTEALVGRITRAISSETKALAAQAGPHSAAEKYQAVLAAAVAIRAGLDVVLAEEEGGLS